MLLQGVGLQEPRKLLRCKACTDCPWCFAHGVCAVAYGLLQDIKALVNKAFIILSAFAERCFTDPLVSQLPLYTNIRRSVNSKPILLRT